MNEEKLDNIVSLVREKEDARRKRTDNQETEKQMGISQFRGREEFLKEALEEVAGEEDGERDRQQEEENLTRFFLGIQNDILRKEIENQDNTFFKQDYYFPHAHPQMQCTNKDHWIASFASIKPDSPVPTYSENLPWDNPDAKPLEDLRRVLDTWRNRTDDEEPSNPTDSEKSGREEIHQVFLGDDQEEEKREEEAYRENFLRNKLKRLNEIFFPAPHVKKKK